MLPVPARTELELVRAGTLYLFRQRRLSTPGSLRMSQWDADDDDERDHMRRQRTDWVHGEAPQGEG